MTQQKPPELKLIGIRSAPPLTDEVSAAYEKTIAELGPGSQIADYATRLLRCCGVWWDLPEPAGKAVWRDQSQPIVLPLTDEHKAVLWEHIPWKSELDSIASFLASLPDDAEDLAYAERSRAWKKEIAQAHRDGKRLPEKPGLSMTPKSMLAHLLWHVCELDLDREPLTHDHLPMDRMVAEQAAALASQE